MGKVLAMAKRDVKRGPMGLIDGADVSVGGGVDGIYNDKAEHRRVSILAREAWEAVCDDLGQEIPWHTRRANILVEGVELAGTLGARIRVGEVLLEVGAETTPCALMEELQPGLSDLLVPDWRGGVVCRVIEPGRINVGDEVEILAAEPKASSRNV